MDSIATVKQARSRRITDRHSLWLGIVLLVASTTANAVNVTVSVGDDLLSYAIDICAQMTDSTVKLQFNDELAAHIVDIAFKDSGETRSERITANSHVEVSANECLQYRLRYSNVPNLGWRENVAWHNGALRIALSSLLPESSSEWPASLVFNLPFGVEVSAPGERDQNGNYRWNLRPRDWNGVIVIGKVQRQQSRHGRDINLSIVGEVSPQASATLIAWVESGLQALTTLYARVPVASIQILIFPLPANADPVPWGEVMRGGGDAVHLYVDATRELGDLKDNWVLVHELSHLIHPYMSGADAWLSEGIASYYQNVLRARGELISAATAWRKLDAGFRRGEKQFSLSETLGDDTRAMMRARKYMRVYWGGAAIALIGDVELRRRSGGAMSLDRIFDEVSRCCLPVDRLWRGQELMRLIDERAGYSIFMPLYDRYVMKPRLPDIEPTYAALGISRRGTALVFDHASSAKELREQIMSPDHRVD